MKNELLNIQNMIYEIRVYKVMLDNDLAALYQVETKYLNRIVKRNFKRFPSDFMFQLTNKEWEDLRCQFGTAKMVGKIRYNPYVFSEQGIAMLSGLLNSDIAIDVNIQIMRAFVQLRHFVFSQTGKNDQIVELRKLLMLYIEKNDKRVNEIIITLNNLIEHPREIKKIGFHTKNRRDEES
ncbi:MAG: ORF6N domain-containing protein [Leptospirales bacterium]|nr:ORF6N domain-containing protein [Leptospirales bacterium]